jgi:glycosyltransferase involved in cell wall biosynthesis
MDPPGALRVLITQHQGGGSGAVTSTLHLALGLARQGVRVRFVCPPGSPVEAAARDGGLEVHPIPLDRQHRFANARALAELMARHPVDLVNAQSSRDRQALLWLALRRRLPAPLVLTRRSFPRSSRLETWLAGRLASRIIAVSEPVAEALAARGVPRSKLAVVHNGLITDRVDVPVSAAAVAVWRARIGWEPTRRTVGVVARSKDQAVVVRALAELETPVRLVLAGLDAKGAGRLPRSVPPRHALVVLPFDPAVRPLYELLEVVLHPSRWEALPQALLEAMALGKPVAASAATGNAVVIRDGLDGLLVEPDDPASWARALDRLLRDPGLAGRLGQAAARRAREDFALARTIAGTLQIYHETVAARRAAPQ